jgi:hypothetical protein
MIKKSQYGAVDRKVKHNAKDLNQQIHKLINKQRFYGNLQTNIRIKKLSMHLKT